WGSDVCSSDLKGGLKGSPAVGHLDVLNFASSGWKGLAINRSSGIYSRGNGRGEGTDSEMLEDISTAFLETIDSKGSIEVALLMRRTGTILGAWTKGDVSREIVSVMAATMLGSIETMSEALGCPTPQRWVVGTGRCRRLG